MSIDAGGSELTARQAALLEELTTLVLAEGFAHLTLDEIASRLHCSKTTLYALAASKERMAARVVQAFFKRATGLVEAEVARHTSPSRKVQAYLEASAVALRPASHRFLDDVAAVEATRTTYGRNAAAARARIRELIQDAVTAGETRGLDADFLAAWIGLGIDAIQQGEVQRRARLTDAEAFDGLADAVGRILRP